MPSPWVQRLVNEHRAEAALDHTLGDRVAADKLIVVTDDDSDDFDPITGEDATDWTGTADYWHIVRRGFYGDEADRPGAFRAIPQDTLDWIAEQDRIDGEALKR